MKPEALLNITEIPKTKPDQELEHRLKEYHDNIERDFQEEWGQKHFKWFFTKRRQKKLRYKISRRYTLPVFWLIEEIVDGMLVKQWETPEFFEQFISFNDNTLDTVCEFCGSTDMKVETAVSLLDPLCVQKFHHIKCCNCGKILLKDYAEPTDD